MIRPKIVGITGASGVLGIIFIDKLGEDGFEYNCFKGDICNKNEIKGWFKENQFGAIIHFAAVVPTSEVKDNPQRAREVNVVGTKNLIDELELSGQKPWLFYASTSHVYKSKKTPINEEDEIEPISIYGSTKYEAENIITQGYNDTCIGRIFSFYHKSQEKPFLYPNIISRLKCENLDNLFELYGANSIRDFLNAEDVADIIVELMKKEIIGTYNIASGMGTTIKDFVQSLTDKKLKIKEMGEQDYLVADIRALVKPL